jgi:cytoplasmic iron level regulating protein YaaA (DUF328/UPF0246 family)
MIFLLPPSETKRDGGAPDSALDLGRLSFPQLTRARRASLSALVSVSRDVEASMSALKIGPRLRGEVDRNRRVRKSPTMPALARYTGVAFDPLAADTLSAAAWEWASEHVLIHSALFGLVGAADPIPAYRLSHDSRVPGLSLRTNWRAPLGRVLNSFDAPVIDLRSEAYVELGPAPAGSAYVRIVSDEGGRRRALNHFNKKTKGALIARLLASRPKLASLSDFVDWSRDEGMAIEEDGGELVLVSESVLSA